MTAPPERRIDIVTARFQGQSRERLSGKHRCVLIHLRACHGLRPTSLSNPYSDSDSSSEGRSVGVSSLASQASRRSLQRASSHSSKRLP